LGGRGQESIRDLRHVGGGGKLLVLNQFSLDLITLFYFQSTSILEVL
jgi:hypothetical protein